MKKQLFLLLALFAISCTADKGADNACQFVKEKAGAFASTIKSLKAVSQDSAIVLFFEPAMLATRSADFNEDVYYGRCDAERVRAYGSFLDTIMLRYEHAVQSWRDLPDSVRAKKNYSWRKVYTVQVTMQSGSTNTVRVLMDRDGQTPRQVEREAVADLDRLGLALTEGYEQVSRQYDRLERELARKQRKR